MYRLQYIDKWKMPCCEWFETHDDAMDLVQRQNIEKYKVRFIEVPFEITRNSVGPADERSEVRHILHWLNRWAADTWSAWC